MIFTTESPESADAGQLKILNVQHEFRIYDINFSLRSQLDL